MKGPAEKLADHPRLQLWLRISFSSIWGIAVVAGLVDAEEIGSDEIGVVGAVGVLFGGLARMLLWGAAATAEEQRDALTDWAFAGIVMALPFVLAVQAKTDWIAYGVATFGFVAIVVWLFVALHRWWAAFRNALRLPDAS